MDNHILIYNTPRLTMKELAEFLQIDVSAVYKWIAKNKLQVFESQGVKYITVAEAHKLAKNN